MLQPKFNRYPKPTDWNSLLLLAQQAFEDGFRAPTFQDLVSKVRELVAIEGGSALVPTVEPGTVLPAPATPNMIMIMKGGSYTQPDGVTPLVAPDNSFNVGYWDGDEWKVEISIETEADLSGYATKSEVEIKADEAELFNQTMGKNLFDKSQAVANQGVHVNISDGFSNQTAYIRSDWVKVEEGKTYVLSGIGSVAINTYADYGDLERLGFSTSNPITIPSGVNYIVFNVTGGGNAALLDTAQLEEGTVSTAYEPYVLNKVLKPDLVADKVGVTDVEVGVLSNNIYNDQPVMGRSISAVNGSFYTTMNPDLSTTPLIDVLGMDGEVIYLSGFNAVPDNTYRWTDDSGTLLSFGYFATGSTSVLVPAGAAGFRVTTYTAQEAANSIERKTGQYIGFRETPDVYQEGVTAILGYRVAGSDISIETVDSDSDVMRQQVLAQQITPEWAKSLRDIRIGGADVPFSFNSPNELADVVIPFIIHFSAQKGTSHPQHLWLGETSKQDFSDIRFFDSTGRMLDIKIESHGNFEIVPDSNLPYVVDQFANGDFIGKFPGNNNIMISTDNMDTWSVFKPSGNIVFINSQNDFFYAIGQDLYRSTSAGGYTDDTIVFTNPNASAVFFHRGIVEDDLGNLYMGTYQDEFYCRVYKSTNRGVSWTEILSNSRQHVHKIVWDDFEKVLYVACDGTVGGVANGPGTYKSTDRGATFTLMSLPWPSDYGVALAGEGYRLGTAEAAIKPAPTLFKTRDDVNFAIKHDIDANAQSIKSFKGSVLQSTVAYSPYQYCKIMRSIDEGETFQSIYDSGTFSSVQMGNAYRYGSIDKVLEDQDSSEQFLVMAPMMSNTDLVPIRYYEGGADRHQALVYVRFPSVAFGSNTFTVKTGYMMRDVDGPIYQPIRFADYELNVNGTFASDSNGNNVYFPSSTKTFDAGVREAGYFPYSKSNLPKSAYIKETVRIDNVFFEKTNGITVDFWYKPQGIRQQTTVDFILGNEDFYICQSGGGITVVINGIDYRIAGLFTNNRGGNLHLYTVRVSATYLQVYVNGITFGGMSIPDTPISSDYLDIGGVPAYSVANNNGERFISDIRIYNQELPSSLVRRAYEGGVMFYPKP